MSDAPSNVDLDQVASEALAALSAQADAADVARLNGLVMQLAMRTLNLPANRVTVSVKGDVIGLAALPRSGSPVAVSGSKADCLAGPKDWVEARCAEIMQKAQAKK